MSVGLAAGKPAVKNLLFYCYNINNALDRIRPHQCHRPYRNSKRPAGKPTSLNAE
jgi:hypothetical protein